MGEPRLQRIDLSDRISDERIAELLDGRVPAEEREELLSRLAADADADDFDVFAELGGVLREAEEEEAASAPSPDHGASRIEAPRVEAPAGAPRAEPPALQPAAEPAGRLDPPSARRPSRWGGRRARWMALVPVLALAVLVPVLWSRRGGEDLGAPAMALETASLPADWLTRGRPWAVTRGDGLPGEGSPGEFLARAARVGALHTDLTVAVAARDSTSTKILAGNINALLDAPGLNFTAQKYRTIRDRASAGPAELQPVLDDAGKEVMELLDADRVRLGAWAEAARLAAEREDSAFFASSEARAVFRRAERDAELPPEAQEAAAGIREAGPGAFDILRTNADALLRAIAN